MKTVRPEIVHVRVESAVYEAIKERARREQRNVSDMARVLIAFALSEMPRHVVPQIENAEAG